ncbi:MAG: DivIVA domain-containing protein [Candidatus Eremiobacteraeota bacterium]|nr:DivIVA domain-containing protein [Candidatus Eremiobacteraeota bacterium]MBV8338571.1 DivIVA domain-containing protein [Candidatus Eremiobacteraeota bacterium]MBV8671448.1 DivIVA domain-containing protein [Candidatus Eremiobacteraeota bacterium]
MTTKLTPVDIQHKEFKKAIQGYAREEVDQFLDEVIETLEAEIDERTRLEAQVTELSEKVSHFKAMEDSLRSTLVLAQRTADELKASAHKEVDIVKHRAKIEIEDELRSVKQQIAEAKAELQRVSDKTAAAKLDLRNFLTRQLELIDDAHPRPANAVAKA